ncbi:MAG TPA: hypothetical protein VHM90_22750, partial [Phycisphaerae bacterium]|nr:hypothetical protein [Phycisphaerae bacterium]
LFDELSALDVIGMPAMQGRVTVIDPTRVNSFGDVMDALLNDPDNLDLSALDADFSVHSFIYAPGTPFHSGTTATDPGIPTTDFHVKLSYANFDRFTTVTPQGQPGPTLVHNPFIGQDPVRLLEGTAQPAVPGIKITRTIDVPAQGGGGTTQQTLSSEGNWLLDTGAAASIISKAQAAKLHVTYQDGTFGTDNPVLVDDNGTPLPNQFHLGIGGIGGQTTLAGFYLDSMLLRSQEGSAADDANPNNLLYTQEPVLVGDITVKDPTTNDTLTLDGIFGMNNLIGSADFSLDSLGNLGDFAAAAGYYKWITFDEPNGILGLTFNPDVVNAPAAAATTPAASLPAVTLLTAAKPLGTAAAQPTTTTTLPQTALPIASATPPSSAIPLVVASSLQTPSPTLTPVTSNPAVLEQQLATSTPPSPTLDLPTLQEFLAVTL